MQRYLCIMEDNDTRPEMRAGRQLDMESLKALAHPLRVKILDTLSTYGDFTASGLAERLGESSGSTSYHLRQLERHGFVREVTGKGTGRERWWARMPGAINLDSDELFDSPANRAVTKTVVREFERSRSGLLSDFQDRGLDVLPHEWLVGSVVSTMSLKLTTEQLKEVSKQWDLFVEAHIDQYRGQTGPHLRPVQIHFNAFPVVDGEESV
ncbi:helix-turn-helix domain-containing protein [Leifsonia kafniensis]|uniref:Helix-turn-helix domain-containing protein n=2 Tax=Leifsonia kafniensis TaxID=475957 RepID=A0ABP7KC77_9MICO